MIGPSQSRAARGLLNWSRADLAVRASIDESLLEGFEEGGKKLPPREASALQRAFEVARVEFLDGEEAAGVRLKPKPASIPVDQLNSANDK